MKRTRLENNGHRTQLVLAPAALAKGEEPFELTLWVDAPHDLVGTVTASAVQVGDVVGIREVDRPLVVTQVCASLRQEDICVPHKLGTLTTLTRGD